LPDEKVYAKPPPGYKKPLAKEQAAIASIERALVRDSMVVLTANNNVNGNAVFMFCNVSSVHNIEGTPKADFAIANATHSLFVSHKAGGGVRAFQQYSGTTSAAGFSIAQSEELTDFLDELSVYHSNIVSNRKRFFRPLTSQDLIKRAIFGPDFGCDFGKDNVHVIGQGEPTLTNYEGRYYTLTFSDHASLNGDVSGFTNGYQPVFAARYTQHRGFEVKGKKYRDVRVLISPRALLSPKAIQL
jgi:hypothetical protein